MVVVVNLAAFSQQKGCNWLGLFFVGFVSSAGAWIFSEHSGFLYQSKNMPHRSIGASTLSLNWSSVFLNFVVLDSLKYDVDFPLNH